MIRSLFEAIANNPPDFVDARHGGEFEDRIDAFLRHDLNYSRLRNTDIADWARLKSAVLMKSSAAPVPNDHAVADSYILQPNGKQNYPDFMVFEAGEVVCIEVKFGKPPRPVWNSGLPRPNGFYILGRRGKGDATFFRGADVVSAEESEQMHAFFDRMRSEEQAFNDSRMSGQRRGFEVYVRKAFMQSKKYNKHADIDFYNSPDRRRLEQNVLDYFG